MAASGCGFASGVHGAVLPSDKTSPARTGNSARSAPSTVPDGGQVREVVVPHIKSALRPSVKGGQTRAPPTGLKLFLCQLSLSLRAGACISVTALCLTRFPRLTAVAPLHHSRRRADDAAVFSVLLRRRQPAKLLQYPCLPFNAMWSPSCPCPGLMVGSCARCRSCPRGPTCRWWW